MYFAKAIIPEYAVSFYLLHQELDKKECSHYTEGGFACS